MPPAPQASWCHVAPRARIVRAPQGWLEGERGEDMPVTRYLPKNMWTRGSGVDDGKIHTNKRIPLEHAGASRNAARFQRG